MPTRSYPVSEIDSGIRLCLDNVEYLWNLALKFHTDNEKKIALIVYMFAVEEFGKAVLLKERKDDAKSKGLSEIVNDDVTFNKHDKKIERAFDTVNNSLARIKLYEEVEAIPFGQELKFQEFKEKGEFVDVDNRLALLFVDYNKKTKKFEMEVPLPLGFSLDSALHAFKQGVKTWKSKSNY